jgi:Flp pilus assembly protein CpaB
MPFNGMLRPGMYVDVLWTGDSSAIQPPAPPAPAPDAPDAPDAADPASPPSAADIQNAMLRTGSQVAQNAGQPTKVTAVLLQNVLVIAVGDQSKPQRTPGAPPDAYNTITFMLPPESARVLVHAMSQGSINLLLRHVGEADVEKGPLLVGPAQIDAFLRKSTRN